MERKTKHASETGWPMWEAAWLMYAPTDQVEAALRKGGSGVGKFRRASVVLRWAVIAAAACIIALRIRAGDQASVALFVGFALAIAAIWTLVAAEHMFAARRIRAVVLPSVMARRVEAVNSEEAVVRRLAWRDRLQRTPRDSFRLALLDTRSTLIIAAIAIVLLSGLRTVGYGAARLNPTAEPTLALPWGEFVITLALLAMFAARLLWLERWIRRRLQRALDASACPRCDYPASAAPALDRCGECGYAAPLAPPPCP